MSAQLGAPERTRRSVFYTLALPGPPRVDRLRRISRDLEIRAVVIRVIAVLVAPVLCHELNDLKRALGAVDVGQRDVCLERLGLFRRVREQSVRQHWRRNRTHDLRRYGPRPLLGIAGGDVGIGRQFRARVY